MKVKVYLIAILILLFGCETDDQIDKSDDEKIDLRIADGEYIGTYQLVHTGIETDTSDICISFLSNQWEGTSEYDYYPALCHGTYSIEGEIITFQNLCSWPTHFHSNFILGGEYLLNVSGDTIEFIRDYGGTPDWSYYDYYRLVKVGKYNL